MKHIKLFEQFISEGKVEDEKIKLLLKSGNIELAYMMGDAAGIDVVGLHIKMVKDIYDLIFSNNERYRIYINRIKTMKGKLEYFLKRTSWGIENKGLKEIPESIGMLENVEVLMLSRNKLKTLPDEFSNLRSLYKLNLSHNNFSEIPKVLYKLKDSLLYLYFDENPISDKKIEQMRKAMPNTSIIL